jgi:hypothetical protein
VPGARREGLGRLEALFVVRLRQVSRSKLGIRQALEERSDFLVNRGIEHSKGVLDEALIKKIFFDVALDQRIQVHLVPAQGAGCVIDMNSADRVNCDGIFCLHGSDNNVKHIPCRLPQDCARQSTMRECRGHRNNRAATRGIPANLASVAVFSGG